MDRDFIKKKVAKQNQHSVTPKETSFYKISIEKTMLNVKSSSDHNYKSTQRGLICCGVVKIHPFCLSVPKRNYIVKLFLMPRTAKVVLLTFPLANILRQVGETVLNITTCCYVYEKTDLLYLHVSLKVTNISLIITNIRMKVALI